LDGINLNDTSLYVIGRESNIQNNSVPLVKFVPVSLMGDMAQKL